MNPYLEIAKMAIAKQGADRSPGAPHTDPGQVTPGQFPAPAGDHQGFLYQAQDLFPGSQVIPREEWSLEDKFQAYVVKCRRIAGNPATPEALADFRLGIQCALIVAEAMTSNPVTFKGIRYAQVRLGYLPNMARPGSEEEAGSPVSLGGAGRGRGAPETRGQG